jgi:hypothetical protein
MNKLPIHFKSLALVALFMVPLLCVAQKKKKPINSPKYYSSKNSKVSSYEEPSTTLAVGLGLDYGGLGTRFTYNPSQYFGVYASAGFALSGFGFDAGVIGRFNPESKYVITLNALYGYNGSIYIQNDPVNSKVYTGPSVGPGVIIRSNKNSNYWHLELLVPFRSSDFDNDYNALKSNIEFSSVPRSVVLSIGYNFAIGQ